MREVCQEQHFIEYVVEASVLDLVGKVHVSPAVCGSRKRSRCKLSLNTRKGFDDDWVSIGLYPKSRVFVKQERDNEVESDAGYGVKPPQQVARDR